jgi:diguanylate cyclase (GGDEF)-like protein/PAS domain S-box-containing protein
MFGWSPSELVGKRSLDFIHPDDQERAINSWMEMLTAPGVSHRVRLRHKRRDGSWLWVEIINHNLVDDPAHKDVKCEVIDVSDEMAAHEALRVREQLLRRLTETLPNGVLQIDGDRRVLYANERLCSIIGTSTSATVDAQFANVVSEDRPAVDRALDAVLVEAQDVDVVVRVQASPTEHRICEMSFRVLTSDDGAVSGAIVCVSDVTESSRMRSELEIRATFDQLTGCHNRESILTTLDATLARTEGPDAGTAAIFVDLDRFKPVNDRFGHAAGDRLLEAVAARLREAVRVGDLVGRVGGDEFLVVCPDVTDPNRALEVGERIASALREPVDVGAGTVVPSGSIGVAWSPRGHADADALVAVADAAMYESKRDGAGLPRLVSIEADAA